jgi:hypothetical protein
MSSNEIAHVEDHTTDLSVFPPRQPVQAIARQVLMEHAELASMAYDFATKLVGTKMVPLRFRNQPEEATAAILYGAELGLGPISALQNIFEVHGSPGIYARTAQALLEAKGFRFKTLEDTADACAVAGAKPDTVVHDWDTDADETSRFTWAEAENAGWTPQVSEFDKGGKVIAGVRYETNQNGKLVGNEKYLTQPRQMLWAKAMMEVCRRLSPATLLGIAYSVEELESEHQAHATDSAPAGPAVSTGGPLTVDEILAAAPDSPADPHDDDGNRVNPTMEETASPSSADTKLADQQLEPEPEPAPVKNKRASKREQTAAKSKPKGHTSRVDAALAKARAANGNGGDADGVTQTPETTPAAEPEPQADPPVVEPSGDPSEPEPNGDDALPGLDEDEMQAKEVDDAYAAAIAAEERGAQQEREAIESGQVREPAAERTVIDPDRLKPALREQLQELTQCIAAAGFQPTPDGRETWFAWLSQEVNRDITANNQLSRGEIVRVIESMREQG